MIRARASHSRSNPDYHVIRSTFRAPDGPVGRLLDAHSRVVLQEARRLVPVRTGTLLASIRRASGQGARGPHVDVIAGVRGLTTYLGYVLFGTEPHIIRPRRRQALRFIHHGAVRFAKRVRHPGSRANPFLQRALEKIR